MTVSVIIPTHNRAHTLPRAINSVLLQSCKDTEIIVVDDRSTDNTRQMLSAYEGVLYVHNGHCRGPAGARNQGIEAASGEYVAFLDSDDEWSLGHLEESLTYLEKHRLDASYALWYRQRGYSWEGYPPEWLGFLVKELLLEVDGPAILLGDRIAEYMVSKPFWCFHLDTLVARRSAVQRVGMFDEGFHSAEDMEFSFRLLMGATACLINSYHARYYEGDDNMVALRTADPVKLKRHCANMVMAFRKIEGLVEAFLPGADKAKCHEQIERKIREYEILR